MNIQDYMNSLAQYDMVDLFGDYESGYICDIISEIADHNISVYTKDQINYAMDNQDSVKEAFLDDLVTDAHEWFRYNYGDLNSYIASIGCAAWYNDNTHTMYENLKECVLYAVLTVLKDTYEVKELTEDQIDELESFDIDNNDMLEDIIDEAVKILGINDN